MSGSGEIPPIVQNQLAQLQQLKLQLEAVSRQKMQVEALLRDAEAALNELEKLDENSIIYRTVGELMIKVGKTEVKEALSEKKETYDLRLKTLERQEERVQKKYQQLQQQLQQILGAAGTGTDTASAPTTMGA
ncbi:MAG: prefoldin subunit beta [Candidatus Methanophagaceae archaeon]|nr:MAG: prefoldin subunit beta [Methanophagales archaeon]